MIFLKKRIVLSLLLLIFNLGFAEAKIPLNDLNVINELSMVKKINRYDFRVGMHKLWEDHVTWTRLYIVSATANLPETEATAGRLLKNQEDIGNAMAAFYGAKVGAKVTALLKEHIMIATKIVAAAMAGDAGGVAAYSEEWSVNADQIAKALSQINPENWHYHEMKEMMNEHLTLTTAQLVAHLNQDWAADIAAYDMLHLQILKMADMLALGIIKQFPNKFSGN